MRKDWKLILWFAVAGLAVTAGIVAYLVVTNTYPSSDPKISVLLLAVIFCPPCLLSIPIIDAETGTTAFYFIFSVIGLMNAALYGGSATLILRWQKKRQTATR
jgi:formate/nitrite transporter FocA (FNT family)